MEGANDPAPAAKTASPKKRKDGETLESGAAASPKKGRASNKNSKTDGLAQNGQGSVSAFMHQKLVQFSFGSLPPLSLQDWSKATILISKRSTLQQIFQEGSELIFEMLGLSVPQNILQAINLDIGTGKHSVSVASTYVDHPLQSHRWTVVAVPDIVSRSNHPWSLHSITDAVKSAVGNSSGNTRIVFCGSDVAERMGAFAASIARAFSVYTQKSSKVSESSVKSAIPVVHISFMVANEHGMQEKEPTDKNSLLAICESIQLAARLVDMPPEELTTSVYAQLCHRIAKELLVYGVVTCKEIVGDALREGGYGGLYGVGKAATHPPRLVELKYTPATFDESVALVGKGIVYDTGGLSLKSKDGMPGMKVDMGGSAGLLGGFIAAVKLKLPKKMTLILCLAENAVGPTAVRNDDILSMYSGKTVEINNTDAEGRLVLADGVAYATKHIPNLNLLIDMATLTGAQLVAAGKTHAGILANSIALEQRAVNAGLRSGDLVVPLLYAPDLLMKEFDSKVADMKNSVKDRSNAQASCAGHFIEAHLDEQYRGGWLHVDMAGPAEKDGRGTGYGVGLVLSLLGASGF